MQTSRQLSVFSTQWANRAAEAEMKDQYPTIISWHESHPKTKSRRTHLEVKPSFLFHFFIFITIFLAYTTLQQRKP